MHGTNERLRGLNSLNVFLICSFIQIPGHVKYGIYEKLDWLSIYFNYVANSDLFLNILESNRSLHSRYLTSLPHDDGTIE